MSEAVADQNRYAEAGGAADRPRSIAGRTERLEEGSKGLAHNSKGIFAEAKSAES